MKKKFLLFLMTGLCAAPAAHAEKCSKETLDLAVNYLKRREMDVRGMKSFCEQYRQEGQPPHFMDVWFYAQNCEIRISGEIKEGKLILYRSTTDKSWRCRIQVEDEHSAFWSK